MGSLPLDSSAHTFKVWLDMMENGYDTLLHKRQPGEKLFEHPYNLKFDDTQMFPHQGFFASPEVPRRVERLRTLLDEGRFFGLSLYYEDENNTTSRTETIEDAKRVTAAASGIQYIVHIVVERPMPHKRDPFVWNHFTENRLSVLYYRPLQQLGYWQTWN